MFYYVGEFQPIIKYNINTRWYQLSVPADMWINEALCMQTHVELLSSCCACMHTQARTQARTHAPHSASLVGYFEYRRWCVNTQTLCPVPALSITVTKCSGSASEEAITGFYTSSPVSPAFCLSADAVNPSVFPSFFMYLLSSSSPLLLQLPLFRPSNLLTFTILCVCLCVYVGGDAKAQRDAIFINFGSRHVCLQGAVQWSSESLCLSVVC